MSNINETSTVPEVQIDGDQVGPAKSREILIFSDFDGTIFMQDTGHILFDKHGCGPQRRHVLDQQIHTGERSFREVSEEMWGSLNVPFDDGFVVMKEKLEIDRDFQSFWAYCSKHNIPFRVISAGLKPVLRRVLDEWLGAQESKKIEIISNDAQISQDGKTWKPIWKDETHLGHDKAASINAFKVIEDENMSPPLIVFIGDGVSDLPAAREADVLFARRGLRLEEYCIEHKIDYIPFESFKDIESEIEKIRRADIVEKENTGHEKFFNPRANFWRTYSSDKKVKNVLSPISEKPSWLQPIQQGKSSFPSSSRTEVTI